MHNLCIKIRMIDEFDWRILSALNENGRLTNRELSEIVNLSPSQCSRRRLILEENDIIHGYYAQINTAKIGLPVLAFMQVNIREHSTESFSGFRNLIMNDPMIQEAYAISGDADYMLKVIAQTFDELSNFVAHKLLALQTISHVKSYIVLRKTKENSTLPPLPSLSSRL